MGSFEIVLTKPCFSVWQFAKGHLLSFSSGMTITFILTMIENITEQSNLGSFFKAIAWIFFLSIILIIFRQKIKNLLDIIIYRIKEGCFVKFGPLIIGKGLNLLTSVDNMQNDDITVSADGNQWEKRRTQIYSNNKGLFMAHILKPSGMERHYDIYIYLIRHKSKNFSDIKYVEFFFGHHWGNKIFKIKNKNKIIGIMASVYGPFLCTCRVKFKDDSVCELYKYIDFETK